MRQLFALHFFILDRVPTINQRQAISPTSVSDKLTQLKKSQTVSKNRKISKIPVVVLFIDRFPTNPDNSRPVRRLATKHENNFFFFCYITLYHMYKNFIKPITNKALKHLWIRNDLPLKSKLSDLKKGGD